MAVQQGQDPKLFILASKNNCIPPIYFCAANIPDALGKLKSLRILKLNKNKLTGKFTTHSLSRNSRVNHCDIWLGSRHKTSWWNRLKSSLNLHTRAALHCLCLRRIHPRIFQGPEFTDRVESFKQWSSRWWGWRVGGPSQRAAMWVTW